MTDGANQRRANRRRDIRRTYANALIWALGNGLVSTFLVGYLALELGAGSVAIAWIVAAPRFAGVLRLAAPSLLAAGVRIGLGRKAMCLIGYGLSGLMLLAIPLAAAGVTDRTPTAELNARIAVLTVAWCIYHVVEYVATVALWSWIGDLYPRLLRSPLLGRRERWLTLGRFLGIAVSIGLASVWAFASGDDNARVPLATSALCGAVFMLLALAPLLSTTAMAARPSATPENPWRTLRRAIAERPYRRLLAFSCWLGFANGLSGAAQAMYPKLIGIEYATLQSYRMTMWSGQSAIAPWCGRMVQRFGARRVMLPAQLIVATGPLWYWMATPDQPRWIALAFVAWIAYAGVNIGLDTLKLNLADPENNAPYLAVYHAGSDLVNAFTVLGGGLLYDTLAAGDALSLRVFAGLFLSGWLCRVLAAPLIARLIEPDGSGRSN